MFRVKPREKKGTNAVMLLPDGVGASGVSGNESTQPLNEPKPFKVSRERVVDTSPYSPDNLEVNDGAMIPRGALNRQITPDTMIGKSIAQSANQTKLTQQTTNQIQPTQQDDFSQYGNVRDRYVGQKSLDEKILDEEAYLDAMRMSKPENKNSRLKSALKSLAVGLSAFGKRPIRDWEDFAGASGEALGYGIYGAFDPSLDERFAQQKEIETTQGDLDEKYQRRTTLDKRISDRLEREKKQAETEFIKKRPDIEQEKINQREKENQRRSITSLVNDLDEFDPADPANAQLVAQMTSLGLPVVKKTRTQKLQYIQDPKTEQWKVIIGNPTTGAATSQAVTDENGKPLVTTSKEKFRQDFLREENDKKRQAMLEKSAADRAARMAIAEKRIQASKDKGSYYDDIFFNELNGDLSDVWGELSALSSQMQKMKEKGETIPDWMQQRKTALSREARTLEQRIAKEQGKMKKAGEIPNDKPNTQQQPQNKKQESIKRSKIPEIMKRKGMTEKQVTDWLTSIGVIIVD